MNGTTILLLALVIFAGLAIHHNFAWIREQSQRAHELLLHKTSIITLPPSPVPSAPPVSVVVNTTPSAPALPPGVGVNKDGFAVPHPASLLGKIANGDLAAIAEGLLSADGITRGIAANYAARLMNDSSLSATTAAFYSTLPAASLALVKAAFLDPKGLYAPDQAGYDVNRPAQQAQYEAAWAVAAGGI